MFASVVIALALVGAPECTPLKRDAPTVLVTVAADPHLAIHRDSVDAVARRSGLSFLDRATTNEALTREGGDARRSAALVEATSLVARAEERFLELETEEALEIIARATSTLAAIHQQPGAVKVLAHAHFLAAAIYLARDRVDAARRRLVRALDLDPTIAPPRHRYAPRVLAELAAVRASSAVREVGRLEVRLTNEHPVGRAAVYVDGDHRGEAPLILDAVGSGRHLVRVSAPGHASWMSTIVVEPSRDVVLDVALRRDKELERIEQLAQDIVTDADLAVPFEIIRRRTGAQQVLLVELEIAAALDRTGTATIALDVRTSGGGRAYAPSLTALEEAVLAAASCRPAPTEAVRFAPAIIGRPRFAATDPSNVPPPTGIWREPWFWAVFAIAAIGVSGGLVAARAAGGPPDAVEVRLIPRP